MSAHPRQLSKRAVEGCIAPEYRALVNKWLSRGDGIAVYRNEALGHRDLGHLQVVSYGSAAAQLETAEPPATMPDIGQAINWAYQLVGVYREEDLLTLLPEALWGIWEATPIEEAPE